MKIIIPGADFSAVKIGTELDLHAKTISILGQVTGNITDPKKVALDNIVRWIYANGYQDSVASMIVPFAAANIPQALRNVWANNYPAFADVSFDPTAYLTLASGKIVSTGKSLSDAAIKTLVGKSLQPLSIPITYSTGGIAVFLGNGGNVNAYEQLALVSGGTAYFGLQNIGSSFPRGYSASNNTTFNGVQACAFINNSPVRYFPTLSSALTNTSGTLTSDSSAVAKVSYCFGLDKNMENKFVCLISGSITDAKLIELKDLVYSLHMLL